MLEGRSRVVTRRVYGWYSVDLDHLVRFRVVMWEVRRVGR